MCVLQRGRELVAVQRHDTIVMIAGEHQGRRVAGSRADVVEGRVRQRLRELLGVVRVPVIGDPCGTDREEMEAQQIQDADRRQRCGSNVRVLCDRRSHQQATVAAAVQGELLGGRHSGLFEMLGDRGVVVEDVLFVSRPAGLLPGRTELSPPRRLAIASRPPAASQQGQPGR